MAITTEYEQGILHLPGFQEPRNGKGFYKVMAERKDKIRHLQRQAEPLKLVISLIEGELQWSKQANSTNCMDQGGT